MLISLIALGLGCLALLAVFGISLRRLIKSSEAPVTVEWARSFSLSAYAPMERLLDDGDFRFLKTQPGYNRKIEKDLRAKRVRIFSAYLGMMSRDFHRLHTLLGNYLVSVNVDDPEISAELIRQKWLFRRALVLAHLRLRLYALGVGSVSCDALLDAMRKMGQLAGDIPAMMEVPVVGS